MRSKIWDAATGTAVRDLVEDRDGPLLNPQWTSPDHALRIDTEGMDGIWLRPVIPGGGGTGVAMSRANRFLFDASWSRDSRRVAYSALFNGEARVATIVADSTGKRLFEQVEDGASGAVGIDPGNRWLVWSVGSEVKRLALDNLDINSAADVPVGFFQFLDDKTMLGVTDGEISLWFTPWFRVSRYFNLGPVSAWAVSPDGTHMALLSPGSLRIYRIVR